MANIQLSKAEQNALSVSYEVMGTRVDLDLDFVKRYLVRGAADKVSDQELVFFMNLCKKMISALAAVALTASVSLSAMAVTAGYSDYGKSDVVAVTPDKKVELVAQGTDSNGSALSTGVKVEIPAGMLPENVTQVSMEVGAVADADVSAAVVEAESKGYDDLKVLDIRLLDQNGNPITQLNGAVSVTVPASGSQNASGNDDGVVDADFEEVNDN